MTYEILLDLSFMILICHNQYLFIAALYELLQLCVPRHGLKFSKC